MNAENLFPYGEGFVKEVDKFPLHLFTVSFHLNSGGMHMIWLLKSYLLGVHLFFWVYLLAWVHFFWG